MSGRTDTLLLAISTLVVILVATCAAADLPAPSTVPATKTDGAVAVAVPAGTAGGLRVAVGAAADYAVSAPRMLFAKTAAAELNADAPTEARMVTVRMTNSSAVTASRVVLIGGDMYFIRMAVKAPQVGFAAANAMSPAPGNPALGPGERRFYRDLVASGRDRLVVDLDWDDPALDPTLTVYPPDGALGTYRDGDDGRKDGRIYLEIAGSEGITPGEWYYCVTGDGTRGLGEYSFTIV